MAKFKVENAARTTVIVINALFLVLGVVTIIIGVIGYVNQNSISEKADLLKSFSLDTITRIVFISGILTVVTALFGLIGAILQIPNVLKIYAGILMCIIALQIGMGAWLKNQSIDSLRDTWEQEDEEGLQRRIRFQDHMTCCGFDYWADSMGQLHTPCPQTPKYPWDATPKTCKQAAQDFMNEYMAAIAAAAISIACIELVALGTACFLIFKGKDKSTDEAFEY